MQIAFQNSGADTLTQVISYKTDMDPYHNPCGIPLSFFRFGFYASFLTLKTSIFAPTYKNDVKTSTNKHL